LASGNIPQGRELINAEGAKNSADGPKRLSSSTCSSKAMKPHLGSVGPQRLVGHEDWSIGVCSKHEANQDQGWEQRHEKNYREHALHPSDAEFKQLKLHERFSGERRSSAAAGQ
jgi:hypothetical protein